MIGAFIFGAITWPRAANPELTYGPPVPGHPMQLGHPHIIQQVDDPLPTYGPLPYSIQSILGIYV